MVNGGKGTGQALQSWDEVAGCVFCCFGDIWLDLFLCFLRLFSYDI